MRKFVKIDLRQLLLSSSGGVFGRIVSGKCGSFDMFRAEIVEIANTFDLYRGF